MKKIVRIFYTSLLVTSSAFATQQALTLQEALEILQTQNLEIQGAAYDVAAAKEDEYSAFASNFGKLDLIQDIARSNDAGNVFGFKLTSREATFGDFGAKEFMDVFTTTGEGDYTTPPEDLNYPEARNYFQTTHKYEVPVFTGFQISSYSDITKAMTRMKGLEKEKLIAEKVYELKKSFYDMALLEDAIANLKIVLGNIDTLQNMTQQMIEAGYAKKVDLLEVQAKRGNVERLVMQMEANEELLYHYISFLLNQKVDAILAPSEVIHEPNLSTDAILEANIDIKRATEGLSIQDSMIDVARASYYPMVGAFGEFATADDSFLGDASDHKAYSVGARLTWNIFNAGIDDAKVEKAKVARLKTQTQLELARQGIALQIAKIKTQIKSYNGEIASLEKELLLAKEIYKNYEGRYREKLSSMSDVIIKQSEQIQKILQLQEVKNKRNERVFALEKLANKEQE